MLKTIQWTVACFIVAACIGAAEGHAALVPPSQNSGVTSPAAPASPTSAASSEAFRIVPQSQLNQWWANNNNKPPPFPRDALENHIEGCGAIAFAIHADGTTTPVQLTKSYWTVDNPGISAQFKQILIRYVAQMRFTPAPRNASRTPVLTYIVTTFTINDNDGPKAAAMKKQCAVSNFAQDMQKLLASPTNTSPSQ